MTVAVIGSSGFIGTAVVNELIKQNLTVRGFDISTNYIKNQDFKFFERSILDINSFKNDDFNGVSSIIYLASTSTPSSSILNITDDINKNLLSFIKFLEFISKKGIKKFIFSSSGGAIYSEENESPYSENYKLGPVSTYGVNKIACEYYLNFFAHKYNFTAINLRISNLYGPGQKSKFGFGVIPTFFESVLKGKEIIIYGGDQSYRDFIFIDDVVNAFTKSIYYNGQNITLNIGSGYPLSILNLVSYIEKITGKNSICKIKPLRESDMKGGYLDITNAKKELDWMPVTLMEDGLKRYFSWLQSAGPL